MVTKLAPQALKILIVSVFFLLEGAQILFPGWHEPANTRDSAVRLLGKLTRTMWTLVLGVALIVVIIF